MKCPNCGAEIPEKGTFCPACGYEITPTDTTTENDTEQTTMADRIKEKLLGVWNSMDLFCKVSTVLCAVMILLLIVALCTGKRFAIFLSVLQLAGVVVAVLLHMGILKVKERWLKYLVLVCAALLIIPNVNVYFGTGNRTSNLHTTVSTQNTPITDEASSEVAAEVIVEEEDKEPAVVETNYTIEKGTEYAYMSDEWNVYIATAISDSIIQVENWGKSKASSKTVDYQYDVGTYKINDSENGFTWLDDEQTAFTITLQDSDNSRMKTAHSVTFTINISDSDRYKGSNWNDEIACYVYTNDNWHTYRAIPLTETLVKFETWSRTSTDDDFVYGYDLCVIDTGDGETDFEWTDEEHTSFTITMEDADNNSYWKDAVFVAFTLENEKYAFSDVQSYLASFIPGEDEAAMPKASYMYSNDDYQEVMEELAAAGFTNISTEPVYDIVVGLFASEGGVDSISVDGTTSFSEGEIFKKDAPIVITYHMDVEDDPNYESASESASDGSSEASESETSEAEDTSVSYSTNSKDTVKNGNSGVYAYKNGLNTLLSSSYYIIDFDEGYVYWIVTNDSSCDRVKIESGDLNDVLIITWHDGDDTWSEGLHFKWKNQPNHLIMQDQNGYEYDFYPTNLEDLLELRDSKTIIDR
ncbi:MAG: zinc ribbon domain-containing protein [Clostridiales bacterium]|nr:zinc ribbon domain-containing protein [Clostridiales bacterium]